MNMVVGFFIGLFAGVLAMGLYLPFRHTHDWTKWEQRTIRVMHIYQGWGQVKNLGEGTAIEEYRTCKTCGKYQEHQID